MRSATATVKRCSWVSVDDPLMLQYHDREWGVPVHDDRRHFEFLVLESAQAGLSWTIVLKKREGYRRAFQGFDPEKVARFSARRIEKLALNTEIIRNRMKIEAAVRNARAFLKIQEEFGTFDSYCWRFVDGRPKLNRWKIMRQIPATSLASDAFSKDLKRRGFSFVGSTVVYAHMAGGRHGKRSSRRLFPLSGDPAGLEDGSFRVTIECRDAIESPSPPTVNSLELRPAEQSLRCPRSACGVTSFPARALGMPAPCAMQPAVRRDLLRLVWTGARDQLDFRSAGPNCDVGDSLALELRWKLALALTGQESRSQRQRGREGADEHQLQQCLGFIAPLCVYSQRAALTVAVAA